MRGVISTSACSDHKEMEFRMVSSSIPRTSGIYKITCTANGKIYIGSSRNLAKRKREHFRLLALNKHHNPHFQRMYDKYGETAFVFEVIELAMPWVITEREQYWLDKLKPYDHGIGFNIALRADSGMAGRKASAETRAKMSISHKGKKRSPESIEKTAATHRGAKRSKEVREKMSEASKGKKFSPEQREKFVELHSVHHYIVTSPDGEEIEISNLRKFCRENNLTRENMGAVARGKQKQHKGWKVRFA